MSLALVKRLFVVAIDLLLEETEANGCTGRCRNESIKLAEKLRDWTCTCDKNSPPDETCCPFCDSPETKISAEFGSRGNGDRVFILCAACGARGPYVVMQAESADAAKCAWYEWKNRK